MKTYTCKLDTSQQTHTICVALLVPCCTAHRTCQRVCLFPCQSPPRQPHQSPPRYPLSYFQPAQRTQQDRRTVHACKRVPYTTSRRWLRLAGGCMLQNHILACNGILRCFLCVSVSEDPAQGARRLNRTCASRVGRGLSKRLSTAPRTDGLQALFMTSAWARPTPVSTFSLYTRPRV